LEGGKEEDDETIIKSMMIDDREAGNSTLQHMFQQLT